MLAQRVTHHLEDSGLARAGTAGQDDPFPVVGLGAAARSHGSGTSFGNPRSAPSLLPAPASGAVPHVTAGVGSSVLTRS
ncbi:hypothetical protein GCM10009858_01860 [Terrabacter carboxydivorans]|uniref:Uncharacterized protein n=1 Tax=Terrabacter carboxydivorans TaxID=619730 RepID=A0ABN3KPE9_9MICO